MRFIFDLMSQFRSYGFKFNLNWLRETTYVFFYSGWENVA